MFKFLRKHHTFLLASLAVCIVGLLLFGVGGGSMAPSPLDTALKVNGAKVTQADFNRLFSQVVRQRGSLTPEQQKQAELETVQELIRQEVFFQESKKYGIKVPDQDLQFHLSLYPAFQTEGKFDPQRYAQTIIQTLGMPINEFEQARRKDIASQKLTSLLNAAIFVPESAVQEALKNRLAIETDKKKKKELSENPAELREELHNREANLLFSDWLGQVNASLKVEPVSADMKKRLSNG